MLTQSGSAWQTKVMEVITLATLTEVRTFGAFDGVLPHMITIGGRSYPTLKEASEAFGVSPKTVRAWIKRGIIAAPPSVRQGLRNIDHFPKDYITKAKKDLKKYQEEQGRGK